MFAARASLTAVRELHARLGSERDFPTWFKYQVETLHLVEGQDYSELMLKNSINSEIKRKRGRPAKDFAYPGAREILQIRD